MFQQYRSVMGLSKYECLHSLKIPAVEVENLRPNHNYRLAKGIHPRIHPGSLNWIVLFF